MRPAKYYNMLCGKKTILTESDDDYSFIQN